MRELRMPVMTYVGKAGALAQLQRFTDADALLRAAVVVAEQEGALGYQAELALQQAEIDAARGQTTSALRRLARATDLAALTGNDSWPRSISSRPHSSAACSVLGTRSAVSRTASTPSGASPTSSCYRACWLNSPVSASLSVGTRTPAHCWTKPTISSKGC